MKASDLVAYNLKRLRTEAGVSQEILAVDASIDRTYVSRIERGLRNCSIGVLEKLAEALDRRISDFFNELVGLPSKSLKPGRKKGSRAT